LWFAGFHLGADVLRDGLFAVAFLERH
jgi:hypothetical protein